jgi:uncharacterized protein (TIGR02246 family)
VGLAILALSQGVRQAGAAESEAREKAIRATAEKFKKAFDAGDAKALAAQWAEDAEYTDEAGRSFRGREAIEKEYAKLFSAHPGATMTIDIESIRFLGPDASVEKGIARVTAQPGGVPTAARYTVVHARRDGKWFIAVGHDSPYVASSNEEYLKGLAWLIGDWNVEGKEHPLHLKFDWMAEKNFIKCTYTVTKNGQSTKSGSQIIGWNAKSGQIVSWHFDAQGGFGNDVWVNDGAKWVIEGSGVLRDGAESTAVNLLTPIDANSYTWQSVERTLDGVALPSTPQVKVVRSEPEKK